MSGFTTLDLGRHGCCRDAPDIDKAWRPWPVSAEVVIRRQRRRRTVAVVVVLRCTTCPMRPSSDQEGTPPNAGSKQPNISPELTASLSR